MQPSKATRLAALYTFCAHFHSGQWSRGYRLMCRTGKAWRRHSGTGPRLDYWESAVERGDNAIAAEYQRLAEAHYLDV